MPPTSYAAHIDRETRNAFNELLALEQLAALPAEGLMRVLRSLPPSLLTTALQTFEISAASGSRGRDGWGFHANSLRPGSR